MYELKPLEIEAIIRLAGERSEHLFEQDSVGAACAFFLRGFAQADDRRQPRTQRTVDLAPDQRVAFAEMVKALGMREHALLQHLQQLLRFSAQQRLSAVYVAGIGLARD